MKVTDTAAYTDRVLKGHEGPVLSLSLDPKKEFLASASCDGSLRIWSLRDTSQVDICQCCGFVDPGYLSRIPDRGSKNDSGSASKNLSISNPKFFFLISEISF